MTKSSHESMYPNNVAAIFQGVVQALQKDNPQEALNQIRDCDQDEFADFYRRVKEVRDLAERVIIQRGGMP